MKSAQQCAQREIGKSLFDYNKELPKAPGGEAALPEAAFWLLLT